jgi:hypothetical protein
LGDCPRCPLVAHDLETIAGFGHAVEPKHFDGHRRLGGAQPLSLVIEERFDAPRVRAHCDNVANAQRAILDEDGGDGASRSIELRFDYGANGCAVRISAVVSDLGD